jgi:D-alanyl-D-alanine carboxypeptidase-like protein
VSTTVLRPRVGKEWRAEARAVIHKLEDRGPFKPLLSPGCYSRERLDLVTRSFDFRRRDFVIAVTLNRQTMIAYLRALKEEPGISLWGPSSSFRDCASQRELWERYQRGDGGMVVRPGESYHQTGRSLDTYYATADERRCLIEHGFHDLLPQDPPHFTYQTRG